MGRIQNTAKHPALYREAPTAKNYLVQNVCSAEVEEPCVLVFYKTTDYYERLQTTTNLGVENNTKLLPYSFEDQKSGMGPMS